MENKNSCISCKKSTVHICKMNEHITITHIHNKTKVIYTTNHVNFRNMAIKTINTAKVIPTKIIKILRKNKIKLQTRRNKNVYKLIKWLKTHKINKQTKNIKK